MAGSEGDLKMFYSEGDLKMFYAAICTECNTGLDGDRSAYHHTNEECEDFKQLRIRANVPKDARMDQLNCRAALKYENIHGKLPHVNK